MWRSHVPSLELICVHVHRGGEAFMKEAAGVSEYWISMWDTMFWRILIIWDFFLKICVQCCDHVFPVCLHGLGECIIVFSAQLPVPVCACVQVTHDPDSAGRSVSFMSPAPFPLKSGSKDKRITPICYDTTVCVKNDFLEVWVVTRWHCGGHNF